jgi:hypothetical protein
MSEQDSYLFERLLKDWQFRRQMVNYYFESMLRLTPNDKDAYQRWRELSGKLSTSLIGFRHASDQLQSYEQEHAHS